MQAIVRNPMATPQASPFSSSCKAESIVISEIVDVDPGEGGCTIPRGGALVVSVVLYHLLGTSACLCITLGSKFPLRACTVTVQAHCEALQPRKCPAGVPKPKSAAQAQTSRGLEETVL